MLTHSTHCRQCYNHSLRACLTMLSRFAQWPKPTCTTAHALTPFPIYTSVQSHGPYLSGARLGAWKASGGQNALRELRSYSWANSSPPLAASATYRAVLSTL